MKRYAIILLWCCLLAKVQAVENSPRIIIVGSGPAGIAAGARLLENGLHNLTILEAEDRIGGRLYTKEFAGYPIDLGGQWVHGEENNAVFQLVWPLGIIEKSSARKIFHFYSSSGEKMADDVSSGLLQFFIQLGELDTPEEFRNKTIGDWFTKVIDEYFNDHPEIKTDQREPLKNALCLMEMGLDAADDWFNVTLDDGYISSEGDLMINWKNKTYGFLIDILLKKFPNPADELPFLSKTVLNAEVSRINYGNPDGTVRITTEKGDEYVADYVIFTPSLGVLKADHEKLFNPPLTETKANAIKGLEFGSVAKIYLSFSEPWWPESDDLFGFNFYWKDEDKNAYANDPNKSWLQGMYGVFGVEHKPKILCCWVTGRYAREMEQMPEETVLSGAKEMLHKFLGKTYNVTEPTGMLRSQWYTNKHFRGTYSYVSPETERLGAKRAHLAEPIIEQEGPRIMFAGEATSEHQSATVHGAVSSGWREADRLMTLLGRATASEERSDTS